MVGPSLNAPKPPTIKFLCSYGGRILPRYPDGKLRYHGGHTRVLSVPRSISFSELMAKLGELCGKTVSLRCQLPTEDLDALVSVTSDEDLVNVLEEYDRGTCAQSSSLKIRAFLSILKKCSPTHSTASGSGSGSGSGCGSSSSTTTPKSPPKSPPKGPVKKLPFCYNKSAGKLPYLAYRYSNRFCMVPNGSHWQ